MNKKVYSQEEYDRMHNEVCKTANLTPEELAECAKVTVGQAQKFFADQKAKILAAAEKDVEAARIPTVHETHNNFKPTTEEWANMVKKARAERDEWEKRYNILKEKYDALEKDNEAFSREYEKLMSERADKMLQTEVDRLKMMLAELYIEYKSQAATA